jgi:hypothetical protein
VPVVLLQKKKLIKKKHKREKVKNTSDTKECGVEMSEAYMASKAD